MIIAVAYPDTDRDLGLLLLGSSYLGSPRGFSELKPTFCPKDWACLGGSIGAI